jgi:RNA polymerase sigma-70 factor (ECF subfamily)
MEERVLSLLAANETSEGAAQVLRAHGPEVLRYLRAILRDETAADDAFSLFAEWTWEGLSRFRGESSLRTFAFGIAWNAARRVRDEAWRKRRERLSSGAAAKLANEIRTSSLLERERRADALEELRRELSGDEQNLLALRIDQRLSWARRPHGARGASFAVEAGPRDR